MQTGHLDQSYKAKIILSGQDQESGLLDAGFVNLVKVPARVY